MGTLSSQRGDNKTLIFDMKTAPGKSKTRGGGVKIDTTQTLDANCNLAVSVQPVLTVNRKNKTPKWQANKK